ncbi:MAG: four helix bundle protein [Chitinophagaceae bacterium]
MQSGKKDNVIVKLTFQFALEIISFTEKLEQLRKYNLANQLFRSGTSIGANVREAQGCESKADFIHKMKLAYKEAEETSYWLELCAKSENYPEPAKLLEDIVSILKILGKIISSSRS